LERQTAVEVVDVQTEQMTIQPHERFGSMTSRESALPASILRKYETHNVNHAVEILTQAYPSELAELMRALDSFSLQTEEIIAGGGNESTIPKKFLPCFTH